MADTETDHPDRAVMLLDDVRKVVIAAMPSAHSLGDADSLLDRPGADSLAFIAMLREVERRYGLSLRASDLMLSDFSSIGAIARYVADRAARDGGGDS